MDTIFRIFVKLVHGERGININLPMPKEELQKILKDTFGDREYWISYVSNPHGCQIDEYTNVYVLNDLAQLIQDKNVDMKDLFLLARTADDLGELRESIENGNYEIIRNTYNSSDMQYCLGYMLYEEGLLDIELPKDLVEKDYINFSAIGSDYEINEGWVHVKFGPDEYFCRIIY